MKLINKILLTLLLLFSSNCYLPSSSKTYGSISLSVKFPDKKFSIKAIPVETYTILVEIDGENMTKAIYFNLTRINPSRTVNVEIGNKKIKATAYDIKGHILAKGETIVYIVSKFINQRAEITLIHVSTDVINSPVPKPSSSILNASPSPSYSPAPNIVINNPNNGGTINNSVGIPTPTPISPQPSPTTENNTGYGGGAPVFNNTNINTNIEIVDGDSFNGEVTVEESPIPGH